MSGLFNLLYQIRGTKFSDFNEAQKRLQQPQPVIKHRKAKSLLLPAPNNIIFELFNTIIKEITTEKLMSFITDNLREFLYMNWSNKLIQHMIRRLQREQAMDVRAGLTSNSLIKFSTGAQTANSATTIIDAKRSLPNSLGSPQSPPSPSVSPSNIEGNNPISPPGNDNPRPVIKSMKQTSRTVQATLKSNTKGFNKTRLNFVTQVYDHIMWRIQTNNVTQISSLLIKMAIDDGYRQGKLKSETYNDVLPCFEDWRGQKIIKLYSFGSAPPADQKLVLASTQAGDLTKWVANYIDGSEKRQRPELVRILAASLRDATKNCIFITNQLTDAVKSLESGAIRAVFLVDRLERYEPITSMPNFSSHLEPLITSGKLYIMSSLDTVEFALDPNSDVCC